MLKQQFNCLQEVTIEVNSLRYVSSIMHTRCFTSHHGISECMEKKQENNNTANTVTSQLILWFKKWHRCSIAAFPSKESLATYKQKKGLGIPVLSLNKTKEKVK